MFKFFVLRKRNRTVEAKRPAKISVKGSRRESGKGSGKTSGTLLGKAFGKIFGKTSGNTLGESRGKVTKSASWVESVDWGRLRIRVVVCIFCALWIGLWGRAWYLQMIEGPRLAERARRQHMASELVTGRRGMITDRNGQVLARSVEARSVYVKPQEVSDFLTMANTLGPLLGIEPQKLYDELSGTKRRFVWIKRKVDDLTAENVRKASITGVGLSKEYDRMYPFKHLAGQLLGFVGMDDKGLEGVERSLEDSLGSTPTRKTVQRDAMGRRFYLQEEGQSEPRGNNVQLTIDVQLQFIAEEAVARAAQEYDARWSGALVVDVPTGDILAWAQYPFFNPNSYRESSPLIYRNRLAADALEPGSTFKPFVMAAALQERKIDRNTLINCEGGKWETKNFTIRDTSRQGLLTADKVLRYSSNIGMAKIGLMMGAPTFHKHMNALGFGRRTNVPVSESKGILRIPRDWSEVDIMSTSFGQSISVTGLQMAQAYMTVLNRGIYKPLRLVREDSGVEEPHERVFSERVTREVMSMMHAVVEESDGTGKRARVEGVEIAGKTGTAQKADHRSGTYGAKRLASFVGFLPADNPRYLILVMVDEPSRNQFGGVVAAPVFREIAGRALTYTGILTQAKPDPATTAANGAASVSTSPRSRAEATASGVRRRGLKFSALEAPYPSVLAEASRKSAPSMQLPGHLARAGSRVPDVMGKSVRNAVELFARAGVVPELKGSGSRVVRQNPPAGAAWPEEGQSVDYTLWLSER